MYTIHSQEYKLFIKEYEKFLHYSGEVTKKLIAIETAGQGGNFLLYQQAVEAHIEARNSYIQLIRIYKLLVQNWQEEN